MKLTKKQKKNKIKKILNILYGIGLQLILVYCIIEIEKGIIIKLFM